MANNKARVVQTQDLAEEVRITTEGQRHLGTVTGSQEYKDQCCSGKVQDWRENIELLAEIVKRQPHAAYVGFTKGYKSRFPYFLPTIDSFEDYVEPIDEAINDIFLPVLFRQTEPLPDELRKLFALPPAQGGLGIPDLKAEVSQQYAASNLIIAPHVAARLAKMNNAGQRQLCKLVAQRRGP